MDILYSIDIRYFDLWSRKKEGKTKTQSHSHFVICTHAAGEIALVVERIGSAI